VRALLLYPQSPDTFWSFKHALKFISKRALHPPLGLLTVAAMLPAEWEKKLVDENVEYLRDQHLEWADYVFISAMAVQRDSVKRLVARCRKAGVKVVAGGPLFTACHHEFDGDRSLCAGRSRDHPAPLFCATWRQAGPYRSIALMSSRPWPTLPRPCGAC
jgi:hypothetical protein